MSWAGKNVFGIYFTVQRLTTKIPMLAPACIPFRDSPFSDQLLRHERNLNRVNMGRLGDIEGDGIIRIAVFADSHQNYKDLENVISEINGAEGVDFVVNLGDSTNSGYNFEYDQFLKENAELHKPVFTAIGNHDALGAGASLFHKAFGPSNFAFESTHIRFVFWNSLHLEDPENFDLNWLIARVEESSKPVVIFAHVPLDDSERFQGQMGERLKALIRHPNVHATLNGHNHGYNFATDMVGTLRLQCPRVEQRKWLLFEINVQGFKVIRKDTGGVQSAGFKNLLD